MIGIVDYGLGNIQAFANIYKRLNIPVQVVRTGEELRGVERIILPGVGAFDWAMSRLNASGMRECLDTMVLNERRPVLGICVGMQMMARRSEEGVLPGLGWVDGEVKKLRGSEGERVRGEVILPHMGWNDVTPQNGACIFAGLESDAQFYFLHSYYFCPENPDHALAKTSYGQTFASAVRRETVYGVQFHPEKSHGWGIRLLKNFAEM